MEFSPLLNGLRAEISNTQTGISLQGTILFQDNIGLLLQIDIKEFLLKISQSRSASEGAGLIEMSRFLKLMDLSFSSEFGFLDFAGNFQTQRQSKVELRIQFMTEIKKKDD